MQKSDPLSRSVAPFLFRHAIPRTSAAGMPGRYDAASQLWIVETTDGCFSVVEAGDARLLETNTSTRVVQEGDDEDVSQEHRATADLLDTRTVTKVQYEGDDDDMSAEETLVGAHGSRLLAELATKTDVQHESDDQTAASGFVELETRSANNQEGIDEDWPYMLFELQTKTFAEAEEDDDVSLAH